MRCSKCGSELNKVYTFSENVDVTIDKKAIEKALDIEEFKNKTVSLDCCEFVKNKSEDKKGVCKLRCINCGFETKENPIKYSEKTGLIKSRNRKRRWQQV